MLTYLGDHWYDCFQNCYLSIICPLSIQIISCFKKLSEGAPMETWHVTERYCNNDDNNDNNSEDGRQYTRHYYFVLFNSISRFFLGRKLLRFIMNENNYTSNDPWYEACGQWSVATAVFLVTNHLVWVEGGGGC